MPLFDKITTYFEETLTSYEMTGSNLSTPTTNSSNVDVAIIRENLLLNSTAYTSILKANKKLSLLVNDIVKLIGNNHKLYQYTISTLSKLYLKNHNWFYSTLRSQLLFKLNDSHNSDLLSGIVTSGHGDKENENIHKFTLIINMCLKEKRIDTKRAKELETIMESKKFEKIIP